MKTLFSILLLSFCFSLCYSQIPFREIDKWGLVTNMFYEDITAFKYDEIGWGEDIYSDLRYFKIGNKYGFLNSKGKEVIAAKYDEVWPFYHKIAKVRVGEKMLVINENGEEVFDQEYKAFPITNLVEDPKVSRKKVKTKLLELPKSKWSGFHQKVNPDSIWGFKNNLSLNPYKKNGKWGMLTIKGEDSGAIFDTLIVWSERMFFVKKGNKEGIITTTTKGNQLRILDGFDEVKVEYSNRFRGYFFRKDNLWGYWSNNNIIGPKYRSVAFKDNSGFYLKIETAEGKLGYIDIVGGKELFSEEKIVKVADLEAEFDPVLSDLDRKLKRDLGRKYKKLEKKIDQLFVDLESRDSLDIDKFKHSFARGSFYYKNRFKEGAVLKIGKWMLRKKIIKKERHNCALVLIKNCRLIYEKHGTLIDKLPNNQTAKIIRTLSAPHYGKRTTEFLNMMFYEFNINADLDDPLNKKIFILFHFHDFAFQNLIENKVIPNPLLK